MKPSFFSTWKTNMFINAIKFPMAMQVEEIIEFYLTVKARSIARELYRYFYEKPREICENCRAGFRFISELIAHKRSNVKCEKYKPPDYWKDKGTYMFQETLNMTESNPKFPMIDEEVASYPKIVTRKRSVGEPLVYFQYFCGQECIQDKSPVRKILARDIVRVIALEKKTSVKKKAKLTGHEHNFWKRHVLQITAKEIIKFQTRRGLKKKIHKVYFKIALHTAEEFKLWNSKLRRIAHQNRKRRRDRREARIERREQLRLQLRKERDLKKQARKEMLAEAIAASKQKARAEAMRSKALRKAKREELRRKREAAGRKDVQEQIAMQKAEIYGEHLVDEAENFLSELKEAKAAVSAAQYGMFEAESPDEEDLSAEDHWGSDGDDDIDEDAEEDNEDDEDNKEEENNY